MTKEELNKLAEQIANVKDTSSGIRLINKSITSSLDREIISRQLDKLDDTYTELCKIFTQLYYREDSNGKDN